MKTEDVFDSLNEWDTEIREKGASIESVIEALEMLRDVLADETRQGEND